jgi:hypothetical protein
MPDETVRVPKIWPLDWRFIAVGVVLFASGIALFSLPSPAPADFARDPVCRGAIVNARGPACTSTIVRVIGSGMTGGYKTYSGLQTVVALPGGARTTVRSPLVSPPPDLAAPVAPMTAAIVSYRDEIVALVTPAEVVKTEFSPLNPNPLVLIVAVAGTFMLGLSLVTGILYGIVSVWGFFVK